METTETRETTETTAAPIFTDGFEGLRRRLKEMVRRTEQRPMVDFGPEFAPLTRALAMITEPQPLLGLIVGGPKLGKTNLLINLALALVEHTPKAAIAFISAEVPRQPLEARLVCAHIARRRMRGDDPCLPVTLAEFAPRGRRVRTGAQERMAHAADWLEMQAGRLFAIHREDLTTGGIDPHAIHRALRSLRTRIGKDAPLVVMLDYDAYLEVDPRSEGVFKDELRLRALRALANRHRALVITPHQARKGGQSGNWNAGGFEATKGSGEFVYAADFVLHLKGRAADKASEQPTDEEPTSSDDDASPSLLIRAEMMNRHGAAEGFFLEARPDQAHLRVAPDQDEAGQRWEGNEPRRPADPAEVAEALLRIEAAMVRSGGNLMGAVRLLGLEVSSGSRMAVRRALDTRRLSGPMAQRILRAAGSNAQHTLPL